MKDHPRPLTRGEIDMAALVFGEAIDYARIRIHRNGYLWFGWQNQHTVMAPDGDIYFMPPQYRDDFSFQAPRARVLFIHEMVHVWQYQLGYRLRLNGVALALSGGYASGRAYRYERHLQQCDRAFSDFNMEQQGEIVAHYFGARHLGLSAYRPRLAGLERLMSEFLSDPANPTLLPKPLIRRLLVA